MSWRAYAAHLAVVATSALVVSALLYALVKLYRIEHALDGDDDA